MADAHAHDDHGHDDDYHVHAHITPLPVSLGIFGALLALTALTVAAYNVRLGELNLAVAVIIASMKATLVGAWFMHLKYEQRFNVLVFLGSLLFVAVFFGYTVNDTEHRGRAESLHGVKQDDRGVTAHGTTRLLTEFGEFQPLVPVAEAAEEAAPAEEAAAE